MRLTYGYSRPRAILMTAGFFHALKQQVATSVTDHTDGSPESRFMGSPIILIPGDDMAWYVLPPKEMEYARWRMERKTKVGEAD